MKIGTRSKMWTLVAAAMVATGLAAAPAGACPPSEGELDLEQVDLSGDGMVALPEGTHWQVLPKTSTTNAAGKIVVDDRVALVLAAKPGEKAAAGEKDRSVLTMKMNLTAAGEVREWLASAVESQERYLKEQKKTERIGMSCTLNAKQCRDAAKDKKIEMPSMYVAITSRDGAERHGWMAWRGEEQAQKPASGCQGEAKAAAPADDRITLTAYQLRTGASDPLTVKMDLPTAKVLLADLGRAIDERNGKVVPVEAEDAATKRKVISASEG